MFPYLDIVKRISSKHGLDYKLVMAFIQVESAWNPWATRYEPDFYRRYIAGKQQKTFGYVSQQTEQVMRCTSFGLMQIMGESARELGYTGAYLTQLCDPETGLDWACCLLKKKVDLYHAKFGNSGFISAYNAGSPAIDGDVYRNQSYVDAVTSHWKQFRARSDI